MKRAPFLFRSVFRTPLRGPVPYDLREPTYVSCLAADRRHLAGCPHPGAVLADAPSFLAAAATLRERVVHLACELATLLIFLRKKTIELLPQHLLFAPAENPLGTEAPASHETGFVRADYSSVGRAVDDLAQLGRRKDGGFGGRSGVS